MADTHERAEPMGESSRYVTVFQQTKDWGDHERGDRFVVHGEDLDRHHQIDEDLEDFVPVAEPIAIIDVGTELHEDELSEWCNSHAGQAVLEQYFPSTSADDPTLRDVDLIDPEEVSE